ncbi:Transmembrane E3 ubiquitin-protein ligase FLY1 [Glycine max]|nr:Transmembrane E3 ubiquitin-protein ligase FLY1 [Glycine max]
MVAAERLKLFCVRGRGGLRILLWVAFWWCVILLLVNPVAGLRPLRERTGSWNDEGLFTRKEESNLGPFSQWNITGTYKEHNKGKGTEHNDQIHMIRCRCRKVSINYTMYNTITPI